MRLISLLSGTVVALTATLLIAGCASTPIAPATDALSEADLAIRRAEQAGAGQTSPLEMRVARDKLAEARVKINNEKDVSQAIRLAEEAKENAELAYVKADEARALATRAEAQKSIDVIRKEAGL